MHQRKKQLGLGFVYRRDGFSRKGGLLRIANDAALTIRSAQPDRQLFTLTSNPAGALYGTSPTRSLRMLERVIVIGCDSAWAYGIAILARLSGRSVSWLPSYHDPAFTVHPHRAKVAQFALKAMQYLGITIYAQTDHELKLLSNHSASCALLSCHGIPTDIEKQLDANMPPSNEQGQHKRDIDLLFLGRPTKQKGWHYFCHVVEASQLQCSALLPTAPTEAGPANLCFQINASDAVVQEQLKRAKILLIPARYESLGIAQLEGILAGCVVPVLGRWPFWDQFEHLNWWDLSAIELARQCSNLCADPNQLEKLNQLQLEYLKQHPLRASQRLPGILN